MISPSHSKNMLALVKIAILQSLSSLWFGHEPSWIRYLGWSVGWSVQNKQSHCRTIFLLAGLSLLVTSWWGFLLWDICKTKSHLSWSSRVGIHFLTKNKGPTQRMNNTNFEEHGLMIPIHRCFGRTLNLFVKFVRNCVLWIC